MPKQPEVNALTVALESESLEALYAAWLEFRLARATARAAIAREREQLDVKAAYLLKTVEAARELPDAPRPKKGRAKSKPKGKALAELDPLAKFHAEAKAELERARKALGAREEAEEADAAKVEARVRKALLHRADQHLAIHKPKVALTVHPVGKDQTLLEVAGLGDEDAALLMRVLHARLPTRWGFFSDDAVQDLARGPAKLYPDEGVTELFPADAEAEDAILFGKGDFLPVRMQIPFALPKKPFPRFRLVHHGPVAQVESRREGQPWSHLVPREDSELLSGYLLRLKLAGKLDLDLEVG